MRHRGTREIECDFRGLSFIMALGDRQNYMECLSNITQPPSMARVTIKQPPPYSIQHYISTPPPPPKYTLQSGNKFEQNNYVITQQIINEVYFAARKSAVLRRFVNFRTNLDNLRISQDICHVWMTDIARFLTIYGHRANLLNNNSEYLLCPDDGYQTLPDHVFMGIATIK